MCVGKDRDIALMACMSKVCRIVTILSVASSHNPSQSNCKDEGQ